MASGTRLGSGDSTGLTATSINAMVAEVFPGTANRCADVGDDFALAVRSLASRPGRGD